MEDFSKGQEAIIEKIAFVVGDRIKTDLTEHFVNVIKLHQSDCPAIKAAEQWPKQARAFSKGFILALIVISTVLGGAGGALAAKIIAVLFP